MTETSIQNKYDQLCMIMYTNIITSWSRSKTNGIKLEEIDITNKEHLFMLHLLMAARSTHNITIRTKSRKTAKAINKYFCFEDKTKRIKKANKKDGELITLPLEDFLNDLREVAKKFFGEDFTFEKIYTEFYETRTEQK